MSYDWRDEVRSERFSLGWFDEIDRRFLHAARLFATEREPFDRLIPFQTLRGARVLEIGCGMGLHSELLARAGAHVTSIDISPTAVEATTRRLELRGLSADVQLVDAEALPFDRGSFDFVWSWGVIHHSSRTALIVRRISEVLTPSGEARVMVYNREGASAWATLLRDYLLGGGFRKRTFDEQLWAGSDGFTARHYVKDQLADLFRAFFRTASVETCGQDSDALPLPRGLREWVLPKVSLSRLERWQARRGAFLFVSAREPF
jgi:2-polyprenyl-3-methyl-5-hydroxy-6-metoxy-1,4-benzoquinol methylase